MLSAPEWFIMFLTTAPDSDPRYCVEGPVSSGERKVFLNHINWLNNRRNRHPNTSLISITKFVDPKRYGTDSSQFLYSSSFRVINAL
jgi:hypothetical protein